MSEKYAATEYRDGKAWAITVFAKDEAEARRTCDERGWTFEGGPVLEFSADEMTEADAQHLCDVLNGRVATH